MKTQRGAVQTNHNLPLLSVLRAGDLVLGPKGGSPLHAFGKGPRNRVEFKGLKFLRPALFWPKRKTTSQDLDRLISTRTTPEHPPYRPRRLALLFLQDAIVPYFLLNACLTD